MKKTVLLFALFGCACATAPKAAPAPIDVAAGQGEPMAPQPLERSLFARSPEGSMSEEKLQEILARPLELELPARVGVLPIIEAEDWRGPGPSFEMVSPGLSKFARVLPADDGFSLVTEMMPIPSGALGMEALREMAARYKLRYLVLYREHTVQARRSNGLAAGYLTGIGALFLPGSTLAVEGYAEASLFDVKTGLLLFTVRRRLEGSRRSTVWQRQRKLDVMQDQLAIDAAIELARDARAALARFREVTQPSGDATASPPTTSEIAVGP